MSYQRQSPDYTELVRKIAAQYPKEWDLANKKKYGKRTDDFVKIFAYEANKVDIRIGLNGKRGNPFDISTDAVAFKNSTVPDEFGSCEVIDIIVGEDHKPAWQDATLPNVAGVWVQPVNPADWNAPPTNGNSGNSENNDLQKQIDELKEILKNTVKVGDKVNFKTQDWDNHKGKFVCSEKDNHGRLIANRESAGGWEEFTVGRN